MTEQAPQTGIESIVFVGPTGAGVTTLVRGIREYAQRNLSLANEIVVPHRYTTRPLRPDDNPDEISSVSQAVFEASVKAGALDPHWTRVLDIHHQERYGFDKPQENDKRIRVLEANGGLLTDRGASALRTLASGLVVAVTADKEVREERMAELFKTMSAEERRARLADEQMALPGQKVEIHTSKFTLADARFAGQNVVKSVILFNQRVRQGKFTGTYREFVRRTKTEYLGD